MNFLTPQLDSQCARSSGSRNLFVLHFKLDIIMNEVIHSFAFHRFENEFTLLYDISDDYDEFLIGVTPSDNIRVSIVLEDCLLFRVHEQTTFTVDAEN